MQILRWLGKFVLGVIAVFVVLAVLVLVGARFHDGPLGIIAGGPFKSGELVGTPPEPDWTFVHDMPTVEFQLQSPARSRTTWILEVDGKIYIPCGYMNSTVGRLWKHWPIEALPPPTGPPPKRHDRGAPDPRTSAQIRCPGNGGGRHVGESVVVRADATSSGGLKHRSGCFR
jgi:hypothetical protein